MEFGSLAVVLVIAFAAPLILGLAPALRLPSVVLELCAGIAVGPDGLGWAKVDGTIEVFATVGLAVLLFLAGLGIELERLRGDLLRLSLIGFGCSLVLALASASGLSLIGAGGATLLTAITLTGTSMAIVIPVLKDTGEVSTSLGQAIIAGSTITGFGAVVLLSLLFTGSDQPISVQLIMIGLFVACLGVTGLAIAEAEHWRRLRAVLQRLEDSSAQIRVRGVFLVIAVFVVLGNRLGIQVVLGVFLAGVMVGMIDRDQSMNHPHFRLKLDGIGFGVFVPVFFVSSGLQFDLDRLMDRPSALVKVPLFLAALLIARGIPAAVYRRMIGTRRSVGAGLLQATNLPFIVLATQIGVQTGKMNSGTAAAFVAAGLASVLIFPALALMVLGTSESAVPAVSGTA